MANTPASSSKQAAQAKPKGSAYCKGPPDHLLVVRYACFVPMMRKIKLVTEKVDEFSLTAYENHQI